jgi:hypothetical protein
VPPMSAERAEAVLKAELGVDDLGELFEWIELEEPLGSASISPVGVGLGEGQGGGKLAEEEGRRRGGPPRLPRAPLVGTRPSPPPTRPPPRQVHKAQLRRFSPEQLKRYGARRTAATRRVTLGPGDTAWSVCNDTGMSLAELAAANKGVNLEALRPGDTVAVPEILALSEFGRQSLHGGGGGGGGPAAAAAAAADEEREREAAAAPVRRRRRGGGGAGGGGAGGGGGTLAGGWEEADGWTSGSDTASDVVTEGFVNGRGRHSSSSNGSGGGGGFLGLGRLWGSGGGGNAAGPARPVRSAAGAAVAHAVAVGSVPASGLVAVKVQYPDALAVMSEDLGEPPTTAAAGPRARLGGAARASRAGRLLPALAAPQTQFAPASPQQPPPPFPLPPLTSQPARDLGVPFEDRDQV